MLTAIRRTIPNMSKKQSKYPATITLDGTTISKANHMSAIVDYTRTAHAPHGEPIKSVMVARQMADIEGCKAGGAQIRVAWANGAECQTAWPEYKFACDWFTNRANAWGLSWHYGDSGRVLWMEVQS